MENSRKIRGFAILAQANTIRQVSANTFKVKSQSGNGEYVVTNGREWDCTCPDHINRLVECKHIWSVKQYLHVKERRDKEDTFQIYREIVESDSCKYCGSTRLVKRGIRKTKLGEKHQYECKKCRRWFVVDDGFSGMRYDAKIITLALDLYFKGLSLRKITSELRHFFNVRVSQVSIYKWLMKYGSILGEYLNTLKPETCGVWNVDDMTVKCSHAEGEKWHWLFNIIDNQSRFLLASNLSKGRKFEDAQETFATAKAVAKKNPRIVITDGLTSYVGAYATRPSDLKEIVHIGNVSLKSGMNLRIERLHGSVREREKVMRSLKKAETARRILNGYRAYYNLIREHQALEGKTPAEASGIGTPIGSNKWLELIRKAQQKREI